MTNDNKTVKEWRESRKELGRQIDPETAEVTWWYTQVIDPYGVYGKLPEECQCIGREYFAAAPGSSNEWVCFGDLPEATEEALWNKHRSKLAFPAGLPRWEDILALDSDERSDAGEPGRAP